MRDGRSVRIASIAIGTQLGQQAPDFVLTDIDRPTVLFFMAAWCVTCAAESQNLARLQGKYGDAVRIISVDVDTRTDTPAMLRRFKDRFGGNWPHALDTGGVTLKYRVRTLDTTYILDSDGIVVYKDEYPTNFPTLERVYQQVVSGSTGR